MIDERMVSMRRADVVIGIEAVLPSAIDITILTADGVRLGADLYRSPAAPRRAALLAPALGVPRKFYRPFAEFLAGEGVATLVVDCRSGRDAALHDWADRDLPAALAHLRAAIPEVPLAWIGHSMGGQ